MDSQSTISVFKNRSMLTNVRKSDHVLRAITNGGFQDSSMVGDFANLGEVWVNDDSIANILFLSEVCKVCRVTMDSSAAPTMNVHRLDGSVMSFEEHPSGLYVFKPNKTNQSVPAYTMISTAADMKRTFTRREIAAADDARALYRKLGRPSDAFFQKILANSVLHNCPVTVDDARRANCIYGPDLAVCKGKTTRSAAAPRAPTFIAVPIPAPVLEHHSNVTLCVDFLFVQGLGFLHTISRNIGYRTSHPVLDRTRGTIVKHLQHDIDVYTTRGLNICDVHGDNEFECARHSLLPVALDIVPADCHVSEVERSNRTIKERLRACAHGLPFKRLPKLLVTQMMRHVLQSLNNFPWDNGISDTLSPATIVTGVGAPKFGAYVQVFEDNNPTNTLRARTFGAIALTPTGNAQGDYFFLSLATGHKISRHNWTEIPMTDTAIARVEALAADEGQPLIQASGLVVEWRHEKDIDPATYDFDYLPPDDVNDVALDAADYDDIDPDELADLAAPPFSMKVALLPTPRVTERFLEEAHQTVPQTTTMTITHTTKMTTTTTTIFSTWLETTTNTRKKEERPMKEPQPPTKEERPTRQPQTNKERPTKEPQPHSNKERPTKEPQPTTKEERPTRQPQTMLKREERPHHRRTMYARATVTAPKVSGKRLTLHMTESLIFRQDNCCRLAQGSERNHYWRRRSKAKTRSSSRKTGRKLYLVSS